MNDLERAVIDLLGRLNEVKEYTDDNGEARVMDNDDLMNAIKKVIENLSDEGKLATDLIKDEIVQESQKI
ncbi:hypothetical protein HW560_11735 [Paenibacillus sp. E222]|uniref:hypothetical protein n=1 Tax=Paenibacillus sp. E222 TaxID=2748863 RepID=UPI0015C59F24|nr:hypothetical protein [Paenibacillus sp. E222]QLG38710.1 hypothetical protein HW560_11735 [Paenibacillus sp. E222]